MSVEELGAVRLAAPSAAPSPSASAEWPQTDAADKSDDATIRTPLKQRLIVDAPQTEGIKYAGSKLKLLPYILQLVQKVKPRTVNDAAATGLPPDPCPAGCGARLHH